MNTLSDAAARVFASEFESLSAVVLRRLETEWRYHPDLNAAAADRQLLQYALEFGRLLKVVYRHRLFSSLHEESQWYAGIFAARGSGHDAFALLLDSWIIAIQGLIKPPECNELARPIEQIRSALPTLVSRSRDRGHAPRKPTVDLLVDALVRGDVPGATALISEAAGVATLDRPVVEVILPAMAEIGRRWEAGEVEIFQEHLATEAVRSLLARLPLMLPGAAPKSGWRAMVSCAPGDQHALIPLALAACLESRGWSVSNLGMSLPSGQIVRAVAAFSPRVLLLTSTMVSRLDEALEVVEQCRVASPACRIILGGRGAIAARAILEARGALVAHDFEEGLRLATEGPGNA